MSTGTMKVSLSSMTGSFHCASGFYIENTTILYFKHLGEVFDHQLRYISQAFRLSENLYLCSNTADLVHQILSRLGIWSGFGQLFRSVYQIIVPDPGVRLEYYSGRASSFWDPCWYWLVFAHSSVAINYFLYYLYRMLWDWTNDTGIDTII